MIVDDQQHLVGIITRGDILRAITKSETATGVLNAGSQKLVVIYPDELVCTALDKVLSNQIGRLPVVSRDDPQQVVGYLGRAELLAARHRQFTDEQNRERGWLVHASRQLRLIRIRRARQKLPMHSVDRKGRESGAQIKEA